MCFAGERFVPGVGQIGSTDEIKREIIHQLSIRPMAHSELVKALPEDVRIITYVEYNFHNWMGSLMECGNCCVLGKGPFISDSGQWDFDGT